MRADDQISYLSVSRHTGLPGLAVLIVAFIALSYSYSVRSTTETDTANRFQN